MLYNDHTMKKKCTHRDVRVFDKNGKVVKRCMKCDQEWPTFEGIKVPNIEPSID